MSKILSITSNRLLKEHLTRVTHVANNNKAIILIWPIIKQCTAKCIQTSKLIVFDKKYNFQINTQLLIYLLKTSLELRKQNQLISQKFQNKI